MSTAQDIGRATVMAFIVLFLAYALGFGARKAFSQAAVPASSVTLVTGETREVPEGMKVVLVPEDMPSACLTVKGIQLVEFIEKQSNPCDGEPQLVVGGSVCAK